MRILPWGRAAPLVPIQRATALWAEWQRRVMNAGDAPRQAGLRSLSRRWARPAFTAPSGIFPAARAAICRTVSMA